MLARRLMHKCKLPRFVYVVSHIKQFSSQEIEPHIYVPPEVRLSPPKDKQRPREPFVKNFFLGKYDTEFAPFPEPQTPDRHKDFFEWLRPIEDYIYNKIDGDKIHKTAMIPDQVFYDLQNLGVFRAIVPDSYKGYGLNNSEIAKLVEVIAHIPCLGAYIVKQIAAINLINQLATERQKEIFLPKIASRELVPAVCLTEDFQGSKGGAIFSVAHRSDCNKFFVLNSTKTFVPNADNANVFLVFAESPEFGTATSEADSTSIFLVERDFGGITVKTPADIVGLRGLSLCELIFKNTTVPRENLIGNVGAAARMFSTVYSKGKEYIGSQAIALTKRFLSLLIRHLKQENIFNTLLFKSETVQDMIAKISCKIYAMESIVYYTTGAMDTFEEQNCDLEKCIVEAYCSEGCLQSILIGVQYAGMISHFKGSEIDQLIRDALCLTSIDGPIGSTKSLVALLGLQWSGKELAETVMIKRNPTQHPVHALKSLFSFWTKKQMDLYVDDNLHPTLKTTADLFESAVKKLGDATLIVTAKYGQEVYDREMELRRISELVTELYVMAAILSRSSRSYCLGMRDAEMEIQITQVFGYDLYAKIDRLIRDISYGEYLTGDFILKNVADNAFEQDAYTLAHPLARNF